MTKVQPDNKQLFALAAGLLIPVVASAHLLNFWLSKSLATAISIFAWMFAGYWIPPRPKLGPWPWLIIVSLISVTTYVLIVLGFDPFWRK